MHIFPKKSLFQPHSPPFSLSKFAFLFLYYGIFAVLCHAVLIFLHANVASDLPADLLAHLFAPMLEHTLMSLCILGFGTLLLEAEARHHRHHS